MTEKKLQELYNAISETIMNLRISIKCEGIPEDLDDRLSMMIGEIWNKQAKILGVKG